NRTGDALERAAHVDAVLREAVRPDELGLRAVLEAARVVAVGEGRVAEFGQLLGHRAVVLRGLAHADAALQRQSTGDATVNGDVDAGPVLALLAEVRRRAHVVVRRAQERFWRQVDQVRERLAARGEAGIGWDHD